MADSNDQRISILTARLTELENESRRMLGALQWSSRVRIILITGLVLFLLIFGVLYFRLYSDIRNHRMAEVRRLINQHPDEFSEPLTRQVILLMEEQGPYVRDVFRGQFNNDKDKLVELLVAQREVMAENLVRDFESKLTDVYQSALNSHETILQREFPQLKDKQKLHQVRDNLEEVYQRVGRRYHVDVMRDRLKDIISSIDNFPRIEPKQKNITVGEEIASQMLELIRMMLINSENFVIPEEMDHAAIESANNTGSAATSADAAPVDKTDATVENDSGDASNDGGGEND